MQNINGPRKEQCSPSYLRNVLEFWKKAKHISVNFIRSVLRKIFGTPVYKGCLGRINFKFQMR